ncbi:hypothetical protein DXT88_20365 [Herbaspirillum lusitanum]|uniref:DUF6630 family protein n=1 Tax=Herbaspirillum lusitanum TaxID=213312 RepID=UPI002237D20B|nr:hypothetical protein [Herbaspirillum lusitanum]MCW5300528.1 hypothetical protein [Herbaspirillum lusitanum]
MLKLLSKLLGRDLTAPRVPTVEEEETLSDAQILKEYFSVSKQNKKALRRFVRLITVQLGVEEGQRLTTSVISHLGPGNTASEAIENGILDDGQRRGKWVLMQVDWKATEEVEWQANELLTVAGITETWHMESETKATVPHALVEFSSWVKPRGLRLLHLDLGDDAYYALLVSADHLEEIVQAAEEAGLKIQESDDFEREHMRD